MERRKFVKNLGMATTGTLVSTGTNLYATNIEIKNKKIDFSPLSSIDKEIILKGSFIDSKTLKPIKAKMIAKIKKNRFFSLKKSIDSLDGTYQIKSGFSIAKNNIKEIVNIQIIADGYKTYNSKIYLSINGCNIHSDEWSYNPNFESKNIPKNIESGNTTRSTFNFLLVSN